MNFYEALNQGDGSLREPHFTSLLYYLFRETKKEFSDVSFIDFFIKAYLPHLPITTVCEFDFETDLKIEEILTDGNSRRDTDLTIYLRNNNNLNIINIENKISNHSYQSGQIDEQKRILETIYPNAIVENVLLIPYNSNQIVELNPNSKIICWQGDDSSLTQKITEYIKSIIDVQESKKEFSYFFNSCTLFLKTFSDNLEQERLSSDNMLRGPRNVLRHTMFQYLSNIANNWEAHFYLNPNNVTVNQLLAKFEKIVSDDIILDFPNNHEEMIAKFKRGALEAQPKIMTINEKNRIHFNITNSRDKQLFYYPDVPNGNYPGKWKNTKIKPLRLMNENENYFIFWKNNITNDVETSIYQDEN